MSTLKLRVSEDMKTAMKAKDSATLGAIRLLLAAIKQKEVDERVELDDAAVVLVIDKMLKQRRDSIQQYTAAQRQDLADKEQAEMTVLMRYMPQQLSADELDQLVDKAIADSSANGMQDMGKVMNLLRPQLAGRADMSQVSTRIKVKLAV